MVTPVVCYNLTSDSVPGCDLNDDSFYVSHKHVHFICCEGDVLTAVVCAQLHAVSW